MFVNTVPVLVELNNESSFSKNLNAVKTTVLGILRHQRFNYGDVLAAIRKEYNFTEKLYDVLLSYQNAAIAAEGVETTWYHSGMQSESLQIHIDDRDNEGIFRIHYDYQTEKFTEHDIDVLHEHLGNLLFDAIKSDMKKLYELELLTADEKQKLLFDFNDTAVDYPRDKCVHQLFEEQVQKTPNKTAIIASDQTLTYAELNEQANRIAHSLVEKGVEVGDIVAFMLPRKSYLIAAMLGILKAGAAYMPIDPNYPQDRIEYMLEDSRAKLFITDENIDEVLLVKNYYSPQVYNNVNDKYCIIYTSGSTGKPKGCMLLHKGVVNFSVNNNVINYAKKHNIKIIGVSVNNVIFDYFIAENIVLLLNGYTTVLCDEQQSINSYYFNDICRKYKVNIIQTTPTKYRILTQNKDNILNQIRILVTSGEPLNNELLEYFQKSSNAAIFNPLGPSECSVWAVGGKLWNLDENNFKLNIHIGKPIANTQIYIVDKYLQPTPIGVTGELCIAGDGVGAGYLNRPELTAEKFIDNPFGKGKLYKTGDLAYWREDGNIAYVGRNDFQVKIRGLRIELGEIENAICGVDGISHAVVVVRKNAEGRQLICAFYTGEEIDPKEIRSHIGKKLPSYMLPHIFTHLGKMPLTSSGKINRKALPEIDLESISKDLEYAAPKNEQQKELCMLMESVLGTAPVGITDDFFDLGGDSLKAIELVSKAHSEGIYFDLQNVFD